MTARQATIDDLDTIYSFWQATVLADPTFLCSPSLKYPAKDHLEKWLRFGTSIVVLAEEGNEIILTTVVTPSTAEITWLRCLPAHVPAIVEVAQEINRITGITAWGRIGIASVAKMFADLPEAGEDEQGNIYWAGS